MTMINFLEDFQGLCRCVWTTVLVSVVEQVRKGAVSATKIPALMSCLEVTMKLNLAETQKASAETVNIPSNVEGFGATLIEKSIPLGSS